MKDKIINVLKNGAMTVEEIVATTEISTPAVEIIVENLSQLGIVQVVDGKYSLTTTPTPVQVPVQQTPVQVPVQQTPVQNQGDNMKKEKKLNCTEEQKAFADAVNKKRKAIYDANKVFVHRGHQVLFAGCGEKALRYKFAVSGFSDKQEIEYPIMYLDWDDNALYDEGGFADQIREIIGNPEPEIKPVFTAVKPQEGVQGAK